MSKIEKTFNTGDVLQASDMNEIVSAINDVDSSISQVSSLIPEEASEINQLADKAYVIGQMVSTMVEIKYAALKELVDNSKLVPGTWYRITDYETIIYKSCTTSAGHPFDLIVFADSVNQINCQAHAALHEGDTYFANNYLNKWQIWYDINNQYNRYDWATSTGKGVIYRMIDEFGNEAPYDFKNIQIYRSYNTGTGLWSNSPYAEAGKVPTGAIACYTFSNALTSTSTETSDMSLSGKNKIHDNIIKPYRYVDAAGSYCFQKLNNNIFFGTNTYCNFIDVNSHDNTFGNGVYDSYFEYNVVSNILGNYCKYCTFREQSQYNTLGEQCSAIEMGKNSTFNTIAAYCANINLPAHCQYITFIGAYNHLYFEGACKNLIVTCSQTTGRDVQCQNIIFRNAQGTSSSSRKTIKFDNVSQKYFTTVVGEDDVTMTV